MKKRIYLGVLLALALSFVSCEREEVQNYLGNKYLVNTSSYDTIELVANRLRGETLIIPHSDSLYDFNHWVYISRAMESVDGGRVDYMGFDSALKNVITEIILSGESHRVTGRVSLRIANFRNYTKYPKSDGIYYLEITDELLKSLLEE